MNKLAPSTAPINMKNRILASVFAGLVASCLATSAASFTYTGGNSRDAANWQNDVNSTTGNHPSTGDTGLINVSGTWSGGNSGGIWNGAVITHSLGTISGTLNMNSPTLTYNLAGGTIDNNGNFNANGSVFNLSSGLLQFSDDLIINTTTGAIHISGSATIEADSGDFDLRINSDDAQFTITTDWTGSFISNSDETEADWIDQLVYGAGTTGTGTSGTVNATRLMQVGGTDITDVNFGDFFVVTPDGNGGSTLTLSTEPIPALALASPFQDRMVLQRGKPIKVWGVADPNAAVSVTFNATTINGTADAQGNWQITLPSLSASSNSASLVVTSGSTTKTINDVLVGDVWFCYGQSNMVYTLNQMASWKTAYINAIAANDNIRCLKIKQNGSLAEANSNSMEWLDNSTAGAWTAVGSTFAKNLHDSTGVPVAIIWAAWGSSSIEGWLPLELENKLPHFKDMMPLYKSISEYNSGATTSSRLPSGYSTNEQGIAGLEANGWSSTSDDIFMRTRPNIIYNKMIHPLTNYGISGFIWYQGEANAGNIKNSAQYSFSLPLMVKEYRERFDQGDLPFLGVQLPSHNVDSWPWFRESQDRLETLSNAHVCVTLDTGAPGNIHPTDKEPIGIRLALMARKYALAESIEAKGPRYDTMVINGNQVTISYTHGTGLTTDDSQNPAEFEIAGADKVFHAATSSIISSNQVVITSSSVATPVAVRYAWSPAPVASVNLVNSDGLPAAPFRTDDWAQPSLGAQTPSGIDDAYEVNRDESLTVPAEGVLENDVDLNRDLLTAALTNDVNHGSLALLADGSFTYIPEAGFAGSDSFTYRSSDATASSQDTTVTINVLGEPSAYYTWKDSIVWNNGDDQTATGDPDKDGVSNLTEFALDMNPLLSDVAGLPTLTKSGNDYSFDFNNAQPGITYEVQLANEVGTWLSPSFAVLTSESTTPVLIPSSNEVGGKLFVRLRVTETAPE